MPTMKVIRSALFRAYSLCYDRAELLEGTPYTIKAQEDAEKFKSLAIQVGQMRCETCKWWSYPPGGTIPDWECLRLSKDEDLDFIAIETCGPNFGCIHHELKQQV